MKGFDTVFVGGGDSAVLCREMARTGFGGVRYHLVTLGENGLPVPYPEHNRFFINRELAQEYIDNHADLIKESLCWHNHSNLITDTVKQ